MTAVYNIGFNEYIVNYSSDDESDDEVIDYLSTSETETASDSLPSIAESTEDETPKSQDNCILQASLHRLDNIRQLVVGMRDSSVDVQRPYSSCPSIIESTPTTSSDNQATESTSSPSSYRPKSWSGDCAEITPKSGHQLSDGENETGGRQSPLMFMSKIGARFDTPFKVPKRALFFRKRKDSDELMQEPHITAQDLGGEPILGLMIEGEPESWAEAVPSHVMSALNDKKQIERQAHIYEFIMTEKHQCRFLAIIRKVFVDCLERQYMSRYKDRLFPQLAEMTALHSKFLKKLRLKQQENQIVDSIADILIEFFTNYADKLVSLYGDCYSNNDRALSLIKTHQAEDQRFADWFKYKESNTLLKRIELNGFTTSVSHRLTKYPLLIEAQIKLAANDDVEREKLEVAKKLVTDILKTVNAQVAKRSEEDRRLEDIIKRIDSKSSAKFNNSEFRKSDIMDMNRRLKFEGQAILVTGSQDNSKSHDVMVIVLTDVLVFLREYQQKYTFFAPENNTSVVSLAKLLMRVDASDPNMIYFISTDTNSPGMYKLKIQQSDDTAKWMQTIQEAANACQLKESKADVTLDTEQQLFETKRANIREVITKMRKADNDHAILLNEKVRLQATYLMAADDGNTVQLDRVRVFLEELGTYTELITDNCDTDEISKRVLDIIQEIAQLAANLYKAANGGEMSEPQTPNQLQDNAYDIVLQLSHHLHTILCIVNQQMTTIANLNSQLKAIRDNKKATGDHELEILRNKIQAEKNDWMKRKSQEEKELLDQKHQLDQLEAKLLAEQKDIEQQRDQLQQMQTQSPFVRNGSIYGSCTANSPYTDLRRTDKRRSSTTKISPTHLRRAKNASKTFLTNIRQQLPFKLTYSPKIEAAKHEAARLEAAKHAGRS